MLFVNLALYCGQSCILVLDMKPSSTILNAITCTRRKLLGIKISWKIWCCMLPKVSYRKSLVVVLNLALVSLYGVSKLKTHCCTLSLRKGGKIHGKLCLTNSRWLHYELHHSMDVQVWFSHIHTHYQFHHSYWVSCHVTMEVV